MDQALNPYTPGSGLKPPELFGRQRLVALMDQIILRTKRGNVDRGIVMSGLRGVGKTVILREFASMATRNGWIVVHLEGQQDGPGKDSVRRRLARGLATGLRSYAARTSFVQLAKSLEKVVGNFSVSVAGLFEISREAQSLEPASTGVLEIDLQETVIEIATRLKEKGQALAIFIDEFQDIDPELMAALLVTQHETQQLQLPFYVIGAGLPNLPATLTGARSYAERLFNYQLVGALDAADAALALSRPSVLLGATFSGEPLEILRNASQGYPYFIQEYGSAIWDIAPESIFTVEDARRAIQVARAQLDSGFFPARWDRATPAERNYLSAMAGLSSGANGVSTQSVAEVLGVSRSSLSVTRKQLIDKGLVYSPERGSLDFTVPGMVDFINRQEDGLESQRFES